MRADEHDLTAFHDDIGFLEVGAAGPDRLHLPPFERQPGLEAFLDKIVVERLAVLDDAHGPHSIQRAITRPAMQRMTKSVLVAHSAGEMFALVDDVEAYPGTRRGAAARKSSSGTRTARPHASTSTTTASRRISRRRTKTSRRIGS